MTVTNGDVRAAVDAMFKSAAYSSFWSRDDMAILAEAALRSYAEGNPTKVEIVKVQVMTDELRPRTGYEGREPSPGELFVAEIDRLRARVAELEAGTTAIASDSDDTERAEWMEFRKSRAAITPAE